jgi:hypothetical protein
LDGGDRVAHALANLRPADGFAQQVLFYHQLIFMILLHYFQMIAANRH